MRDLLPQTNNVFGSPLRNLASILLFMTATIILATLGYMAAGWSFGDSLYMVLLTVYTVGFTEVHPIDSPFLRVVTIGTMVLGCTGMILLTSSLVQVFTVLQLRELLGGNRMEHRIKDLSGHVIVCGYGRIGVLLARELGAAGTPLVVVERGVQRLAEAEAAGYVCISGDATDERVLHQAGIERARVIASVLPDDAANVFITLSARTLSPHIEIIARGEAPSTESKLLHAGANRVVLPTRIGAERIARLILFPETDDISEDTSLDECRRRLSDLGLELEKVVAHRQSTMCGITVAEAERLSAGSLFIVGIERGDQQITRPSRSERIEHGDEVLIVVRDAIEAARSLFAPRRKMRTGRMHV